MSSIIFFYISAYFIGFLLCIPIGPVNLEVFHYALRKKYTHAISIAVGAAIGDSVWAISAFFGISPFRDPSLNLEWIFFLITSVITFILGVIALKDAKFIEQKGEKITSKLGGRKRWSFIKGLLMVLVNPLGIISWMISLKFLESFNIKIPLQLNYEILFVLIVIIGATSYFSLVIFITNKMKNIFNHERTVKISKYLGYILIAFSIYFFGYSVRAFLSI